MADTVSVHEILGKFPASKEVFFDYRIEKLDDRSDWGPRRLALTNSMLFVCFEGEDITRDCIPISEVLGINSDLCVYCFVY